MEYLLEYKTQHVHSTLATWITLILFSQLYPLLCTPALLQLEFVAPRGVTTHVVRHDWEFPLKFVVLYCIFNLLIIINWIFPAWRNDECLGWWLKPWWLDVPIQSLHIIHMSSNIRLTHKNVDIMYQLKITKGNNCILTPLYNRALPQIPGSRFPNSKEGSLLQWSWADKEERNRLWNVMIQSGQVKATEVSSVIGKSDCWVAQACPNQETLALASSIVFEFWRAS